MFGDNICVSKVVSAKVPGFNALPVTFIRILRAPLPLCPTGSQTISSLDWESADGIRPEETSY